MIFLFMVLVGSLDELFVEGTCNVFVVDVCVVLESYGVVVLLWWSFVG